MGHGIPSGSRRIVEARDLWMCGRCGVRGSDWHHRRSRRVRDEHRHCPCNGVILCRSDHDWLHAHPEQAMAAGMIVGQWEERPWTVPIRRSNGWWLLRCAGVGLAVSRSEITEVDGVPTLTLAAQERLKVDMTVSIW